MSETSETSETKDKKKRIILRPFKTFGKVKEVRFINKGMVITSSRSIDPLLLYRKNFDRFAWEEIIKVKENDTLPRLAVKSKDKQHIGLSKNTDVVSRIERPDGG